MILCVPKQTESLTAEEFTSEKCGYTVNDNDAEKRLYHYISTVFKSDIYLEKLENRLF